MINIKSKSEQINSEPRKHKKEKDIAFKEHEFIKPQNNEVEYILSDTNKDSRKKLFIHLYMDVFMISNIKLWKIMKNLFYQSLLKI